uniref:CSON002371 protein n=1 Tax=Culicoides sonorensis TaxID=179676 RepID=A0A336LRT2_CULSO
MDGQKNYNLSQENHSQYTYGRPQDLYLADQFQQQQQQQQQQYYFNSVYDTEYTQKYISPGNEDMFRSFETTPTQTQPYSMKQYNNPKLLEKIEQDYDDYSPLRMHSKSQTTATSRFKQQYQQLQEEKMRLQIKTQNDAFLQQQQTFALRQQLNPPVPSMYPQSPISVNSQLSILQQQEHYKLPPTNLNLGTQYYYIPENKQERIDYSEPNSGKDFSHKQDISGQFQQNSRELLSPLHNQVIIQQNHPNKVVNQAVQTQMSDTSQKSSSSTSNTPQSPSHNIIERRKSESLKSPIIKRMQGAPISLSGYLYKQGSDGLKVWKKRYFVLSEYCLFYYKSNEQEKLLGSVLLPSYTISPCTFEDKVYRKYAFKCEHTNMRTYVLAAETQKSMDNWITYLRMAATMQDNTENSTPSSNKSCNISELPIFQTQITEAEALSSPNEKQPMYINAPPKPLRKAASDVNYLEHHEQDLYDAPRNTIQLVDSQSVFGYHNEMVRTDILEKGTNSTQDCKPKNENSLSSKKNLSTYSIKYADQQTTGRRTPNEYSLQEVPLNKTSYEDDYGAMDKNYYVHTKNYRRPLSPRNNIHSKNYNINDQLQVSPLCVQVRDKTVTQQVPRPHSAEFLDLENRLNLMPNELQKGQATRPKSSLDINRALDHFYYSEESYAEQMRSESANYIQKSKFKVNPMYPEVPNLKQAESRAQKISKRTLRQQEFLRSASARVPRKDEIQSQTNDNDKKREESMKRLLEWKQRMLQSPLTRKTTSQTNTLPLENRQSVSERLKNNMHRTRSDVIKTNDNYNSFSSDDEASISVKTINFLPKGNLTIKTEPSKPRQNLPRDNDNEAILPCYEKPNDINFEIIDKHNKIKAGELLNRTHEELVLLLIHLRKENTIVVRHIEKCCTKIHEVQNNIRITDGKEKEENLSKLNHLKQQLSKLEKKYEENKPLVNLVDNMVKLGSFYNKNAEMHYTNTLLTEQNQKEQERRMFADEQKQWERISPNPFELKNKVQQLDELDQLLNQESNTLQSLQRDKEGIEQAISGLQTQLENNDTSNSALIAARRQQHILEQDNRKLEEELLVLRQKLQMSRDMKEIYANSEGVSSYGSGATAILESELRRVQVLVADMQRQREDLCIAVRQLTDNSNSLYNQLKKRSDFKHDWSETDMDNKQQTIVKDINSSKVYYGDEGKKEQFIQENMPIKTVRIVKREAGKRQKDRERVDKSLNNLEEVLQEELNVLQEYNQNRDRLQLRDYKLSGNFCLEQFENRPFIVTLGENSNPTVGENKNSKLDSNTVYQSEAAKQIITEMSYNSQENLEADMNKRLIPKEKKRHNTAPHHINSQFIEQMQSNKKLNNNEGNFRALDDIDIEVAIRPRLNAPDVIKSAIGQREKISESTIDKLFTTPDKILIPERYIADEELELSPDEEKKRKQKVEAIKKMLRETPSVSMSKIVAARALQFTPSTVQKLQFELSDDDDDSPIEPLPIYQIRENFYA